MKFVISDPKLVENYHKLDFSISFEDFQNKRNRNESTHVFEFYFEDFQKKRDQGDFRLIWGPLFRIWH